MHAIGVLEGPTLLEVEGIRLEIEDQQAQEEPVPEAEGGPEVVLECPNHEPSSFMKGKPRRILSPLLSSNYLYIYDICIVALCLEVGWNPSMHNTNPCPAIRTLNPM
jgi:hypothetical protein